MINNLENLLNIKFKNINIKHDYYTLDDINKKVKIIEKIDENIFLLQFMKTNIYNSLNNCNYYNYNNNNIYIFYDTVDKNFISKYILNILHVIQLFENNNIQKFLNNYQQKDHNYKKIENLNIFIILTNYEKHIDYTQNILSCNNVNSGMSYSNTQNDKYIMIWRKEEVIKVLIHELLHNLDFDCKYILPWNYKKIVLGTIKNNYNDINVVEAYTEMMAILLHSLLYTIIHTPYEKKESLIKNIKSEIMFSFKQSIKILKFYKINNICDLKKKEINNFNQESNIFSYYILKILIFFELCNFKDFNNTKSVILDTLELNENKTIIIFINCFLKCKNFILKNDSNLKLSILKII